MNAERGRVFTTVPLTMHEASPLLTRQPTVFVDSPFASALWMAAFASVSTSVVTLAPWKVLIA